MNLRTEVQEREDAFWVFPIGRLDSLTYALFDEAMAPLTSHRDKGIVLNLQDLHYISSMGIRSIIKVGKVMKTGGKRFAAVNPQPQIRKVFEIINALPDLSLFQSEAEADAYFDTMQKKVIQEQKS